MRRSIAPSYVRSRFTTCLSKQEDTKHSPLLQHGALSNTRAVRSIASIINILSEANIDVSSCKAANEDENLTTEIQNKSILNENNFASQICEIRVFSVVWGKQSKKKHKTWEGDGTLEVGEKSVILKDMDGKIMGQASGLRTALIQEGSHLNVNSKEVEIIELKAINDSTTTTSRNKEQEYYTEDGTAQLAKRSRKRYPDDLDTHPSYLCH